MWADFRGEKNTLFVGILGGEQFLEKCQSNIFKQQERGLKNSDTFRILFWILFRHFSYQVLNGFGVDGVGGILPFFYACVSFFFVFVLSFAFLRFSLLFVAFFRFFRFSLIFLKDKRKRMPFTAKIGNSLRPRLHRPLAELPDKTFLVFRRQVRCADLGHT